MLWLRKSKKGFTLVELMVVVAIIGILALLGLRLFLMQQIRAKNAICKANAATVHTIIQGNLADTGYSTAALAVDDIRKPDGTANAVGFYTNTDRPAGMKNPHKTAPGDYVVMSIATPSDSAIPTDSNHPGAVVVLLSAATANKFYVVGLDDKGIPIGEQYMATK